MVVEEMSETRVSVFFHLDLRTPGGGPADAGVETIRRALVTNL